MLILLPLPSSLQRDGAIVVDLTVHVVLSAFACLSSDCDAALDAVGAGTGAGAVDVTVEFPTDTIVSVCFGTCVPLAFNDSDADGTVATVVLVVVAVAAAAVVIASTLFTDDLVCN